MKFKNWPILIGFIVVCELSGVLGAFFTTEVIPNWYAALTKPAFVPPNWLFGPVWTTLYIIMGISGFLIWQKKENPARITALKIFSIQLIANTLWSIIFFGLHQPLLALVDILILWVLIILMVWKFYKIDKTAGLLQIPYLIWVSFASILNLAIVMLN